MFFKEIAKDIFAVYVQNFRGDWKYFGTFGLEDREWNGKRSKD